MYYYFFFFFFSSRRRHTRFDCDWSSDVCSSDLLIFKRLGLRVNHGLGANGGSLTNKLNQYTLIMDLLWGNDGPKNFGSILQTHDFANPTDGDMFWRASDGSYGKGCCSLYDGIDPAHNHKRGEWARVVLSVDLASTPRKVAKFINGFKHREDVMGDGNAVDGRFALPPEFFMFGDGDDDERTDCYLNSLQIRQGAMTDEEVVALGGPSAEGIPLPYAQWDFDAGNLAATLGHDLQYIDASLASRYQFGTTTQFGIPDIGGRPARVIHIPWNEETETDAGGLIFKRLGLRVNHGLGANGGSLTNKLNQYTLIMDLLWGTDGPKNFGSILQTHDLGNPTDGDMFWRASDGSYGKGCCSLYDAIDPAHNHKRGEWARVVFSVDLASTPRKVAKFVNGFKHREDVIGDGNAVDSRFSLPPEFFMFGDGDDDERTDCYVNSLQIRQGAMTDEDVVALGGASVFGIPAPAAGAAVPSPVPPRVQVVSHTATDLTVTLTGGRAPFTLQRRADLNPATQWQDVGAVSGNSVTISNVFSGAQGYYRFRGQ